MDKSIIGIGIALGVSFFLLYNRNKEWLKIELKFTICIISLIIGIIGFLMTPEKNEEYSILFYGMIVPIIYLIVDRFFRYLSYRLHNRDFYLHLMFSDDIDWWITWNNPHMKTSDYIFSIGILITIVGSLFIGLTYL